METCFLTFTLLLTFIKVCFLFFQTFFLLHEEGFFVGASSGLNVAAAVKVRNECKKLMQQGEV